MSGNTLILQVMLGLLFSLVGQSQEAPVQLMVLGHIQDAGSPQLGCEKACCRLLSADEQAGRMVSSLALFDPIDSVSVLIDATPDIARQMRAFSQATGGSGLPGHIFLTHAHIGHYTGLMYLGREAAASDSIPVYAMPRMKQFLENNGPWSLLSEAGYLNLRELQAGKPVKVSRRIRISALPVPHRDEFSETVGFLIKAGQSELLFIPDIDKWELWQQDIREMIRQVDLAFLDGTFYNGEELPGRDMSEIPHPFIRESMAYCNDLDSTDRAKIHFIHLNHTNPALKDSSEAAARITDFGARLAKTGMIFGL